VKIKRALLISAIVAAVVSAAAISGVLAWRTISHTGADAVGRMNSEEREWLNRIVHIRSSMGAEQVYEILGTPTTDMFGFAKWNGFGGSQLSQLRVYFSDGHPTRIRWIKLGYFIFESDP